MKSSDLSTFVVLSRELLLKDNDGIWHPDYGWMVYRNPVWRVRQLRP